jgi:hypothetical protein
MDNAYLPSRSAASAAGLALARAWVERLAALIEWTRRNGGDESGDGDEDSDETHGAWIWNEGGGLE